MNICRDCEHQLKPAAGRDNDPESLCKSCKEQNPVAGESYFVKCKEVNFSGRCSMWTKKDK